MKRKRISGPFTAFLALVLLSTLILSVASAEPLIMRLSPDEGAGISGADVEKDIGVGGMQISKTYSGILDSEYTWTGYTDIWKSYLSPVKSIHQSKSRIGSTPFDIDVIGVRGRVWQDESLKFDQPQTNEDSADAQVNYQSSEVFPWGYWYARSDHTFEYEAGNDYWYPMSYDSITV